jgi:hypothetical protein
MNSIEVTGRLSAQVLLKEKQKEARIYFAIRSLDMYGSGNFDLKEIVNTLSTKQSQYYLIEGRYVKERINSGSGTFWYVENGRLWLMGIDKILLNLGGETFGDYATILTHEDIFKSHKRFKRALYETIHCVASNHPIARETIKSITGLGPKAQRNLETSTCVEFNFARTNLFWNDKNNESVRWQKPHMFKMKARVNGSTADYIAFQIANTYTPFERSVKKISRSLREKNRKLWKLAGERKGLLRDQEQEDCLVYGTTEKEIERLRDGSERSKFTYYFKDGRWKAVLPTSLYDETYNRDHDDVGKQFARMGIPFDA